MRIELFSGHKPIVTTSVNKVLVHWSRVQFSCALVHLAWAPLWCGRSVGVLCGLRAYNPMSWSPLRTDWLFTATPVALRSSWRKVVAGVLGFLRADTLTYQSWAGVVLRGRPSQGRSATKRVTWNFLHKSGDNNLIYMKDVSHINLANVLFHQSDNFDPVCHRKSLPSHCTALGSTQSQTELGSDYRVCLLVIIGVSIVMQNKTNE